MTTTSHSIAIGMSRKYSEVNMGEIVFQIPRFEKNKDEFTVFSHLEKFLELSQKLYGGKISHNGGNSQPITVLQELKNISKIPVLEIQEFFQTLIDAAFAYKKPEHRPPKTEFEPIFPEKVLYQWFNWKQSLKASIEQHRHIMNKLQRAQESCWITRGRVQKHSIMVDTAQAAIPNFSGDPAEYKARDVALRGLKRTLAAKLEKHVENVTEYDRLISEEAQIRDKVKEYAYNLRSDIIRHIKARIEKGLEDLRAASHPPECRIPYDSQKLSEGLYDITSKQYQFVTPPMNTAQGAFNEAIPSPRLLSNKQNFKDVNQTYVRPENTFTAIRNASPQDSSRDKLKLKKGDKVKLLFMNSEGSTGFGWRKHNSLSFKRWGFFQISDMAPNHRSKIVLLGGSQDLLLSMNDY